MEKYKDHTIPSSIFIGGSDTTEKLYALEEKRNNLIQDCAKELAQLCNIEDHWKEAIPQALHDVLRSYVPAAGVAAALGVIRSEIHDRHGRDQSLIRAALLSLISEAELHLKEE